MKRLLTTTAIAAVHCGSTCPPTPCRSSSDRLSELRRHARPRRARCGTAIGYNYYTGPII